MHFKIELSFNGSFDRWNAVPIERFIPPLSLRLSLHDLPDLLSLGIFFPGPSSLFEARLRLSVFSTFQIELSEVFC